VVTNEIDPTVAGAINSHSESSDPHGDRAYAAGRERAEYIYVNDQGDYFPGTDVEMALQEIGPTMTNSRTPTAHAASHGEGQADAITITNIPGSAATVTDAAQPAITSVGPLTGLEVAGAGGDATITITAPLTTNAAALDFKKNGDETKARISVEAEDFTATGSIEIQTHDTTSLATRMKIKYDGKVGINTLNPEGQLHVYGETTEAPALFLEQDDGFGFNHVIGFKTNSIGVGDPIEPVGGKTLTTTHFIKCSIDGIGTVYIPVGTIN
jgi:hypothetical protein